MSASSAQQSVEQREAVKDGKTMKPPIKPKPIVPPKPKHSSVSTNSDGKSPILSPNSVGPFSPTFDIPSAFKISQLTGPQPYGARRTSLKRWSSSVGEEGSPESNTLLSPTEYVVPELSAKVTTQPLVSSVKPLQSGSVWKGKSPFMLTTRGWGEQRCQGKDESESSSQKHSFSLASNNADLQEKKTIPEANTVINSSSTSRSVSTANQGGVDTNAQNLKNSSASEPVEKTSSGKLNKLEVPIQEEPLSQLSSSPQTDLYFGSTKQSTQYKHEQDTKTEDISYKSGKESTQSPKDFKALTQVNNTSIRTKDHEEPQLISIVPTETPRARFLDIEKIKKVETTEEIPPSDSFKPTTHELYRFHQDKRNDVQELREEEQDEDSGYLQTSESPITITNQSPALRILGKPEPIEKVVSPEAHITDKPLTRDQISKNIPQEDIESPESQEHDVLYTAQHYHLHKGKTHVAADDINKSYTDQEEVVGPSDMQTPSFTKSSTYKKINSEGEEQPCTYIKEEEHNRPEYDVIEHTEEYVSHQVSERKAEYPSEYRSVFGNNAKSSYESEIPSAPELPEPEDNETSAAVHVGSRGNDGLIPGEVYSHPVNESEEPTHSYMEKEPQLSKPQEELCKMESYRSRGPELDYDEPQLRYSEASDPATRVTQPEEFGDHYKPLSGTQPEEFGDHYKPSSVTQPEEFGDHYKPSSGTQPEEFGDHYKPSSVTQPEEFCGHYKPSSVTQPEEFGGHYKPSSVTQPEEFGGHYKPSSVTQQEKFGDHYKPSSVTQPEEFGGHYKPSSVSQPEEFGDHYKPLDRLEYYTAHSPIPKEPEAYLDKPEPRDEEPPFTYGQSQEQESLVHTVEQDQQSDYPVHTFGQFEEPESKYHQLEKDEESENPSDMYEDFKSSVQRHELSKQRAYDYEQEPDSRYQQSEESDFKYEPTVDSVHSYHQEQQKYKVLEEPYNRDQESDETVHRDDQQEEALHGYTKPVGVYDQTQELHQRFDQPDTIVHKYQNSEEPAHGNGQPEEAVQKYEHSEDSHNKYERSEESEHRSAYLEEAGHKFEQSEESEYRYVYLEEPGHKHEQSEDPGYQHKGLGELVDKYEQTEHSSQKTVHKYETSEEPSEQYKHSEDIQDHFQSREPDNQFKQHDEPIHSYELITQDRQIENPAYIHKHFESIQPELIESLQLQYKHVESEEIDNTPQIPAEPCGILVKCPEKDLVEYLEQQLRNMEVPKQRDTSTDVMDESDKASEEQVHDEYPISEDPQLPSIHKEETQHHTEPEEAHHVDGSSKESRQESPSITIEPNKSMAHEIQDQGAQMILNGHAEHGELQTVDHRKEIEADEPEDTQAEDPPVETFDFLEGTVVLDSSFMRGKASLGKKRGHRTPAGACASEEEKSAEYWMFRDSTEPKSPSEKQLEEEEKVVLSQDSTPDNSPSPVKSPNKKGIFGGIISPSLLKGRLKTRSKTTEDETIKPDAEESKSPGKEKPESSGHSMNWLSALKKKKKSVKESKEEKKKSK